MLNEVRSGLLIDEEWKSYLTQVEQRPRRLAAISLRRDGVVGIPILAKNLRYPCFALPA